MYRKKLQNGVLTGETYEFARGCMHAVHATNLHAWYAREAEVRRERIISNSYGYIQQPYRQLPLPPTPPPRNEVLYIH